MRLFALPRRGIKIARGVRASLGRSRISHTVDSRRVSGNARYAGIAGAMLLVGICSAFTGGSREPSPSVIAALNAVVADTVPSRGERAGSTETFYAHGVVNVRSGPGRNYPLVRTLARGESMRLGPADTNGWAELFSRYGSHQGYVYRASQQVRSSSPAMPEALTSSKRASPSSGGTTSRSRSSASSRGYHTGPRGGCYTYTASGRKRYVDRSYCN